MTKEEMATYHEAAFDAYCKKVIRNAARMAHRKCNSSTQTANILNANLEHHLNRIQKEDRYTTYERIFHVRGFKITVRDEAVGEALQYIMPNKRMILLLSYFCHHSDVEIAAMLNMTAANVGYLRKQGLIRLRSLLEARNYGK